MTQLIAEYKPNLIKILNTSLVQIDSSIVDKVSHKNIKKPKYNF